jgi:hypothetical protein
VQDVYIDMDNRGGCCSGPIFIPVVKLGKPEYQNSYDSFEKDEIICHIPKKIQGEGTEKVTIKLRNVLGRKSLAVDGILAYKKGGYGKKEFYRSENEG